MGYVTEGPVVTDTALSDSTAKVSTSGQDNGGTLVCPACGTQTLRRTARDGFMQRIIYSSFGYFPWKCSKCKIVELIKNRGKRRRRRRSEE
jgi:hypothetical protein